MEEVDEHDLQVERIAALDLGKATLEACVRVPHQTKPGRRLQEVRGYATTTGRCWGWRTGCAAGGSPGW
jgi:transposase